MGLEEAILINAKEEGIEIGTQQTEQKYNKRDKEIILNLREKGLVDSEIMEIMHISLEELNSLLINDSEEEE